MRRINRGLKFRLLCVFVFVSVCLMTVGAVGLLAFRNVLPFYKHIAETNLPSIIYLGELAAAQRDMIAAARTLELPSLSAERKKQIDSEIDDASSSYFMAAKNYQDFPFAEGEQELWQKIETSYQPFTELVKQMQAGELHNVERLGSLSVAYVASINALRDFHAKQAEQSTSNAEKAQRLFDQIMLASLLLGLITVMVSGFRFSRSLSASLSGISEGLTSTAERLASTSGVMRRVNESLAENTSLQASGLTASASSTAEIRAAMDKNAENTEASRVLADQSKLIAQEGSKTLSRLIDAIGAIDESNKQIVARMEESHKKMEELAQVIAKIGTKTQVINDIVFQTKLLSFNASVESARAGEHGKGFAVVAEEVGKLASMSGEAAAEISDILRTSMESVNESVASSSKAAQASTALGAEKLAEGKSISENCVRLLERIIEAVTTTSDKLNDISLSSERQSTGVKEIIKLIEDLHRTTDGTVATSAQAGEASSTLEEQTLALNLMVMKLSEQIDGPGFEMSHSLAPKAAAKNSA